jgi:hypothetical protein
VASDPERSRFGVRGFQPQGKLASWIRDPRNPEGDVVAWDPESKWRTGGFTSEDRHLGVRGLESQAVDIASGYTLNC